MTSISVSNFAPGAALDLQSLRNRLDGELITPGDDAYDEVRALHDFTWDRKPWAIVRAGSAADVVQAVRFARLHRLPITARSGGHSVAGYSMIDGALVVDVSQMRKVSIDAAARTARVQSGATSGDLAGPAHAYGLALSTGDTSTVGIAGLTLGGGIGFMVRKYGLAIDNLLSVELVTADGRLIRASKNQHSDLFWALRGGGGNFGIVTEFEFQLAPVGAVYGGALILPARADVVRKFLDYGLEAPRELTMLGHIMTAPPLPFIPESLWGKPVFLILSTFAGDAEAGEQAMAPMRALAEPIADLVGPMPYPAMYEFTQGPAAVHGAEVRSCFAAAISGDVIETMLDSVGKSTAPMTLIQLRPLGGAMADAAPGETAFAHRESNFLVLVVGGWFDPSQDGSPFRQWAVETWDRIKHIREGVYVNFVGNEGEARVREAYPEATYKRLAEVKARYDPANIFHYNQNVKPA